MNLHPRSVSSTDTGRHVVIIVNPLALLIISRSVAQRTSFQCVGDDDESGTSGTVVLPRVHIQSRSCCILPDRCLKGTGGQIKGWYRSLDGLALTLAFSSDAGRAGHVVENGAVLALPLGEASATALKIVLSVDTIVIGQVTVSLPTT
jgi:hypothetical protein